LRTRNLYIPPTRNGVEAGRLFALPAQKGSEAMTAHPNRSKSAPLAPNPTPADVRAARESAGMTQTEAAAVVYCTLRAWQDWESGERRMHPATWELWQIKTKRRQRAQG
jgi:DNA-binding transcriptional regulator YiaG